MVIRYRVYRQRWDDNRNEPREGELVHRALLFNAGCWAGLCELTGHRSMLTSSMVATSYRGPLTGCGYAPTLTSSVVGDVCAIAVCAIAVNGSRHFNS